MLQAFKRYAIANFEYNYIKKLKKTLSHNIKLHNITIVCLLS